MGITFFTFNGLFAPLQQLAGWLAAAPFRTPARTHRRPHAPTAASLCSGQRPAWATAHRAALPARRTLRPLRVVRVVEAQHAPAAAGRMVISGRMADVCAELDRLAALAPEHAQAR
jgi:hypothetical protein